MTREDGWSYTQALIMNKDKGAFTVEGKTITYNGLLRSSPTEVPMGFEIVEVDAVITATCP